MIKNLRKLQLDWTLKWLKPMFKVQIYPPQKIWFIYWLVMKTHNLIWFSCLYLCVLIETLQHVPSPVSVLGIFGESVHVEETFHSFWSQQVVSVRRLKCTGEVVRTLYNKNNNNKKDDIKISVSAWPLIQPVSPTENEKYHFDDIL